MKILPTLTVKMWKTHKAKEPWNKMVMSKENEGKDYEMAVKAVVE